MYTLTLDFLVRSGYKQSCIVVLCDRGDAFCKWDVGLWGESYRSFYSQIFIHSFRHNSIPIIPKWKRGPTFYIFPLCFGFTTLHCMSPLTGSKPSHDVYRIFILILRFIIFRNPFYFGNWGSLLLYQVRSSSLLTSSRIYYWLCNWICTKIAIKIAK